MALVPRVWIPYPRPAASVELRGGLLYSGCQCTKRDGLQQDCPRSECQGRAACLAYPAPECGPSGNAPGRHHAVDEPEEESKSDTERRLKKKKKQKRISKKKMTESEGLVRMGREGYVDNPCLPEHTYSPCTVHKAYYTIQQ